MKQFPRGISYRFCSAFGPKFGDRKLKLKVLVRQIFVQKILRINGHVAWPVHWTSQIKSPSRIRPGTRFPGLALGCYLDGRNGIQIGDNVWIGPGVKLISMNHDVVNYCRSTAGKPIIIGDNCWLCSNVVILPEVVLGNHVVCAAGSVVTKSILRNDVLVAGVPATVIREIPPYQTTGGKNCGTASNREDDG